MERACRPVAGDYAKGKQVYETACAACHGADLKGVAGLPDMPSGAALRLDRRPRDANVAEAHRHGRKLLALRDNAVRLHTPRYAVSRHQASLSADEIYAVSAYILAEGKIIDKAAVLDAESLPKVDMPNRDGFIPDPRPELFK